MKDIELPALPEPDGFASAPRGLAYRGPSDFWFRESVRAFALQAVAVERERCAFLAENERVAFGKDAAAFNDGCEAAANSIRNQGRSMLRRLLNETPEGV